MHTTARRSRRRRPLTPVDPRGLIVSTPRRDLHHDLQEILPHLAAVPRRRQLEHDPIYRRHRAEIERVLHAFEWRLSTRPPGGPKLHAVTWNVERGKQLEGVVHTLAAHPQLRDADLVLVNEVDIGMGRTGNRNVPRELATALGLDYVYCNMELLLSPGDAFERDHGRPNTLSLHGCALLTRLPVRRVHAVTLPEFTDKFHALEKRLGSKRALLCEVTLADGPLTVVLPHLDPFAPPRHRAAQMRRLLAAVDAFGGERVLLGGDLNTNTYSLGTRLGLAANIIYKLGFIGFDRTIREYMTPERRFERGVFQALRDHGYQVDPFNDRAQGTCYYDIHDPELADWTRRYVPRPLWRWLQGKLAPWGGRVPLRLDWMAGRSLQPLDVSVVDTPTHAGIPVSDHNPITVRVRA